MWQDWVIALVQAGLAAALIPTLLHKTHKPAFSTAAMTFVLLAVAAYTFLTLDLLFTSIMTAIAAAMWCILAIQRMRLNR